MFVCYSCACIAIHTVPIFLALLAYHGPALANTFAKLHSTTNRARDRSAMKDCHPDLMDIPYSGSTSLAPRLAAPYHGLVAQRSNPQSRGRYTHSTFHPSALHAGKCARARVVSIRWSLSLMKKLEFFGINIISGVRTCWGA